MLALVLAPALLLPVLPQVDGGREDVRARVAVWWCRGLVCFEIQIDGEGWVK